MVQMYCANGKTVNLTKFMCYCVHILKEGRQAHDLHSTKCQKSNTRKSSAPKSRVES